MGGLDKKILSGIKTSAKVPFGWLGGKAKHVKKIIPLIPDSEVYAEPYCGCASICRAIEPRCVMVLNDINQDIINLFRILQDKEKYDQLIHKLIWTPYSVDEFKKALEMKNGNYNDIDTAWAFFVRQNQGFAGAEPRSAGEWGRTKSKSANSHESQCTSSFRGRLKMLETWRSRLTRVQLDNRDALAFIKYWDSDNSFFYIDPPYIQDTRRNGKYQHEVDDQHHKDLVALLLTIKGKAILSCYDHPIYTPLKEANWEVKTFNAHCFAVARTHNNYLPGEYTMRTETLLIKN